MHLQLGALRQCDVSILRGLCNLLPRNDTPMRSLVFAEQFYFPDGWGGAQIPRDITVYLARHGFSVTVVCGSEPYVAVSGDPGPDPADAGVRIVRLRKLLGGDIHRFKLARQLWFYMMSMPALLFRRRPAAYVVQTNPPLLVPLGALVTLVRRVPFVIIAQDIYPEVVTAHGMLRADSFAARILQAIFGWAYRRADKVIALGPTMVERLERKGVVRRKIELISNWATGDEDVVRGAANRLRGEWQLTDKFVILYSGNLGIAHEIESVLRGLALAIPECPSLRLLIIGKGSRILEAQALARELRIADYVLFRPLVPAPMLPHTLGLADLALVTLRSGFEGLVVPSKLLGYMARGIPVAYIGPRSDVPEFLAESNGGVNLIDADAETVAATFSKLSRNPQQLRVMGENAARYYRQMLSRPIALERYRAMLEALTSAAAAPSGADG